MRIYTNIRKLQQYRFLATTTSVAGLLMLVTATITSFMPQLGASSVPLLLIGTLFATIGLRITNRWTRSPQGHLALAASLKGLPKTTTLLNYYKPIPYILLTQTTLYAIITRNQPIHATVENTRIITHEPFFRRLRRFLAQDTIGTPVLDALAAASRLADWLTTQGIPAAELSIQPLVVFTHPEAVLTISTPGPVPIVYADKRSPSLKSQVRTQPGTAPSLPVDAILSVIIGQPPAQ